MKAQNLHDWLVTVSQAMTIQRKLAELVSARDEVSDIRLVAGVDISVRNTSGVARGAVVVLNYPELTLRESQIAEKAVEFPYVPGLLSFRESPVILAAGEKLTNIPDLILVDGQGIAHPRRLGLASHLGLLWDRPTIGCAKSRLCGEHRPVETEPGRFSDLLDGEEIIGAVLRTRADSKPLYVSVGHKISLEAAIRWVLRCCRGHRLPEPTRLAHLAAGGQLIVAPTQIMGEGYGEINGRHESTNRRSDDSHRQNEGASLTSSRRKRSLPILNPNPAGLISGRTREKPSKPCAGSLRSREPSKPGMS